MPPSNTLSPADAESSPYEQVTAVAARREYATQAHANSRIEGFTNPDPRHLANVQAYIAGTKTNEEILAELIAEYSEIEQKA